MKTAIIVLIASLVATPLTGCGILYSAPTSSKHGHVILAGDAPGVRALFDGMIGQVSEAKSKPNTQTSYWKHRSQFESEDTAREREITKRTLAPSWISELFHAPTQAEPQTEEGK